MAVLAGNQLAELRRAVQAEAFRPDLSKATFSGAFQAVEDRFEAVRSSFGTAIENAVPGVFSAQEKSRMVRYWLKQKFDRGG